MRNTHILTPLAMVLSSAIMGVGALNCNQNYEIKETPQEIVSEENLIKRKIEADYPIPEGAIATYKFEDFDNDKDLDVSRGLDYRGKTFNRTQNFRNEGNEYTMIRPGEF